MELILLVKAVVLGIVEGLTEFLPVSSTGHLIIVGDVLDLNDERAKTFEIFIQLGAILAVAWLYRERLLRVVRHLGRPEEQRFVLNLFVAFLPAAILGLLLHRYIKEYLFNPITVALALIVGGVAILLIERFPRRARVDDVDTMQLADALKIGIAQTFALFPGVSRAGATIMGGLLTGLSRTSATEFSFFLAIPTMLAATVYDLAKNYGYLAPGDALLLVVGFVTAFVTAIVVVKLFIAYVSRHNFAPFAYYRIGFGLLVLWYFFPT
jgi:undecaprenyl-diphosphatase